MRYRQRSGRPPRAVNAIRVADALVETPDWLLDDTQLERARVTAEGFEVRTPAGWWAAPADGWIVEDVNGQHMHPVTAEFFAATYIPAGDG